MLVLVSLVLVMCHVSSQQFLQQVENSQTPTNSTVVYQIRPPGGSFTYSFQDFKAKSANDFIKLGFTYTGFKFPNYTSLFTVVNDDFHYLLKVYYINGTLHITYGDTGVKWIPSLEYTHREVLKTDTYYEFEYRMGGGECVWKLNNEIITRCPPGLQLPLFKGKFRIHIGDDGRFAGDVTKLVISGEDVFNSYGGDVKIFMFENTNRIVKAKQYLDDEFQILPISIDEPCDDEDCFSGSGSGSGEPDDRVVIPALSTTTDLTLDSISLEPQPNTSLELDVIKLFTTKPQYTPYMRDYSTPESVTEVSYTSATKPTNNTPVTIFSQSPDSDYYTTTETYTESLPPVTSTPNGDSSLSKTVFLIIGICTGILISITILVMVVVIIKCRSKMDAAVGA